MRTLLALVCLVLSASSAFSQDRIRPLPKGALVIETRQIPSTNRSLVLWMVHPKKNPNTVAPDDVYPCPDQTRGSFYSGLTRVSLVDSTTRHIINTVEISGDSEVGEGFDVPYAIRKGYYYRVAQATSEGVEAKPTIMRLQDYNGDGQALEFALFDAPACMGLQTTLVGYSKLQDKVIQYPIQIESIEGRKHSTATLLWADYLFSNKPTRPGYWKYEVDYRGRGGSLDQWEVHYNSQKEHFEARVTIVPGEP